MSREIKFRAWIDDEHRMIDDFTIFAKNGEVDKFWYKPHIPSGWKENGEVTTVNPSDFVVMQYTGLKDANSKEIYEGDILEFSSFEHGKGRVVVEYRGSMFIGLRFKDISEVIGNIYENPELLTNEK